MEAGLANDVRAIDEIVALPGKPENLLARVERLRQHAEAFQETVEEERRAARALLEELLVRQAERRGRGRRMD
jgi:hypothetical protein